MKRLFDNERIYLATLDSPYLYYTRRNLLILPATAVQWSFVTNESQTKWVTAILY